MLSDTDKRIFLCVFAGALAVVIAVSLQWRMGHTAALGIGSLVATVIGIYSSGVSPPPNATGDRY